MNKRLKGFTLIELLTVVAVLGVLAAIAFPNMRDYMDKQRLVSQVRRIAELAQFARSEAIKHSGVGAGRTISMTVNPTAPWFVGLSNGTAACTVDSTCVINQSGTDVTYQIKAGPASECPNCTMTVTPVSPALISFDLRGVATGAGAEQLITLTSPMGKQLSLGITRLGRISLCTPGDSVGGYQTCLP